MRYDFDDEGFFDRYALEARMLVAAILFIIGFTFWAVRFDSPLSHVARTIQSVSEQLP